MGVGWGWDGMGMLAEWDGVGMGWGWVGDVEGKRWGWDGHHGGGGMETGRGCCGVGQWQQPPLSAIAAVGLWAAVRWERDPRGGGGGGGPHPPVPRSLRAPSPQQAPGEPQGWARLFCVLRGTNLLCYRRAQEAEGGVQPALTIAINKVGSRGVGWGVGGSGGRLRAAD